MLITYFRSSSYNSHDSCEQQYFGEYVLGHRFPTRWINTDIGTICHKALEMLAIIKQGQQDGKKHVEDDVIGKVSTTSFDVEKIVNKAYKYYSKLSPQHAWSVKDLAQCYKLVDMARVLNDGMFDPLKRHIIAPEQHFDFTIDKPWAHYKYHIGDEILEGQLALKGTVDLVTQIDDGVLEVIDWKTGKSRNSWTTGKLKQYEDFQKDPQLMFYFYALKKLYPDIKHIVITIYYIQAGGPFTVAFCDDDLPIVEKMIREKFEHIRSVQVPKLTKSFKCKKTCELGMRTFEGTSIKPIQEFRAGQVTPRGQIMSICEQLKFETERKGLNKVTEQYTSLDHNISNYKAPGEA